LFSIINQSRLICGWKAETAQSLNEQITVWARTLNRYQIPFDAYEELLARAIDLRQMRLNQGHEMPGFSAELLISCWTGEFGLQRERMAEKANLEKAILPAHYDSPQEIEQETGESFDEWFQRRIEAGAQKMRDRLGEDFLK
jgi:hypothetical protein